MDSILTHDGIEWHCFYDYDAPQAETDTDPPLRGIATIYSIYIRDKGVRINKDLIDHIDTHTIYALERELEDINEDY